MGRKGEGEGVVGGSGEGGEEEKGANGKNGENVITTNNVLI